MKNICSTCGHAFIAANPNRGPKPRYCGRKCWPTTSLPHTKQKDLVACARCATQFSRLSCDRYRRSICRERTQCSHWLCNARKGDRGGGEQLALVG